MNFAENFYIMRYKEAECRILDGKIHSIFHGHFPDDFPEYCANTMASYRYTIYRGYASAHALALQFSFKYLEETESDSVIDFVGHVKDEGHSWKDRKRNILCIIDAGLKDDPEELFILSACAICTTSYREAVESEEDYCRRFIDDWCRFWSEQREDLQEGVSEDRKAVMAFTNYMNADGSFIPQEEKEPKIVSDRNSPGRRNARGHGSSRKIRPEQLSSSGEHRPS